MSDPQPNPYAPPTSGEPQSDFGLTWQVVGLDLRAKNGVTLPMVDLLTGNRLDSMETQLHTVKVSTAKGTLKALIVFGVYIALSRALNLEEYGVFLPFLILLTLLYKSGFISKDPNAEIKVWTYVEPRRENHRKTRRAIRISAFFACVLLIVIPAFTDSLGTGSYDIMLRWVFPSVVFVLVGLAIWNLLDQPKPRAKADVPGWLRFPNIHPDALAYLREREAEHLASMQAMPAGRSRLIRNAYYHRYPLRMLLGKRIYNPLAIVQVVLMKLFRSPLLVRKIYHFSEADKMPLAELSTKIRKQVDAWMANHADWTWIDGERLPSPLGDIMVDTAILAAPGLEHCVCFHYVWSPLKPYAGTVSVKFLSYSINGTSIWTQDHPHLDLKLPNVEEHRAGGSPERVFQAHLRNCEGHMIRGPGSAEELLRRIEEEKEITDRILTERGYQDEVRQST
jgi:hypothetical protein